MRTSPLPPPPSLPPHRPSPPRSDVGDLGPLLTRTPPSLPWGGRCSCSPLSLSVSVWCPVLRPAGSQWMYIVPVVLFLMMSGAPDAGGQGGGGGGGAGGGGSAR